jgi:hypothetical protein
VYKRSLPRLELWRAVEAQHVISTMVLVDNAEEQRLLEEMIDATKPAPPAPALGLHYLLSTPFRYPPFARGSRFRGPADPGVFYGADEVRTACAELGYWRWRFLRDSPALESLEPQPQTVFRVQVRGPAVDLRRPPFVRKRKVWTHPDDYGPCQAFARDARTAGVRIIRYESVRDPERGGAAAVLAPEAFARRAPLEQQTWYLRVTRTLVRWYRAEGRSSFEFTPPEGER